MAAGDERPRPAPPAGRAGLERDLRGLGQLRRRRRRIRSGRRTTTTCCLRNAFGNYKDLLRDVSLHPVMGAYLSHLRNDKSDPRSGRYPDENYAREIMQLFSIGLFQLKPDGTFAQGRSRPADPDLRQRRHHRARKDLHRPRVRRDRPQFRRRRGELDPADADVRGAPRAGSEVSDPRPLRPAGPDRHAGRRGGDRQPVPPPQRRSVHRAPADPAPRDLEPEPRLHPARLGARSPTTAAACAGT